MTQNFYMRGQFHLKMEKSGGRRNFLIWIIKFDAVVHKLEGEWKESIWPPESSLLMWTRRRNVVMINIKLRRRRMKNKSEQKNPWGYSWVNVNDMFSWSWHYVKCDKRFRSDLFLTVFPFVKEDIRALPRRIFYVSQKGKVLISTVATTFFPFSSHQMLNNLRVIRFYKIPSN